jgi:hypothetical protein
MGKLLVRERGKTNPIIGIATRSIEAGSRLSATVPETVTDRD